MKRAFSTIGFLVIVISVASLYSKLNNDVFLKEDKSGKAEICTTEYDEEEKYLVTAVENVSDENLRYVRVSILFYRNGEIIGTEINERKTILEPDNFWIFGIDTSIFSTFDDFEVRINKVKAE
jgi:hypothetical protein